LLCERCLGSSCFHDVIMIIEPGISCWSFLVGVDLFPVFLYVFLAPLHRHRYRKRLYRWNFFFIDVYFHSHAVFHMKNSMRVSKQTAKNIFESCHCTNRENILCMNKLAIKRHLQLFSMRNSIRWTKENAWNFHADAYSNS